MITITIYEENGVLFTSDRKITEVMLNKKQSMELIDWLIDHELEFQVIADGNMGYDVNLTQIKLDIIQQMIKWYEEGKSFIKKSYFVYIKQEETILKDELK